MTLLKFQGIYNSTCTIPTRKQATTSNDTQGHTSFSYVLFEKVLFISSISRVVTWLPLLPIFVFSRNSKCLALFFRLCRGVTNNQSHLLQAYLSLILLLHTLQADIDWIHGRNWFCMCFFIAISPVYSQWWSNGENHSRPVSKPNRRSKNLFHAAAGFKPMTAMSFSLSSYNSHLSLLKKLINWIPKALQIET